MSPVFRPRIPAGQVEMEKQCVDEKTGGPEKDAARLHAQKSRLAKALRSVREVNAALEEALADCSRKRMYADLLSMELEQVFNCCTDPMWVVREDGAVVRINKAMADLLGRPVDEVVGSACVEVLGEHCSPEGACPVKSCKRSGMFHTYEINRPFASGEGRHFLVSTASLMTIDGLSGFVAQYKDITPQKQAERVMEQANAELERLAGIDGLTGVSNRRTFDNALRAEWNRLSREKRHLCVILCDIDHFKNYNDALGHQPGDDCLRKVADALAASCSRPADLVARYGGEEFVFLLPETPPEGGMRVAEAAREKVAGLALPHPASPVCGYVTLSFGVAGAVCRPEGYPDALIGKADAGLYQAKQQGRNRVCRGVPD